MPSAATGVDRANHFVIAEVNRRMRMLYRPEFVGALTQVVVKFDRC